jgi:hypothetical protein
MAKAGGNDLRAGALWTGLHAAERERDWPLCQQRAQELLDLPPAALSAADRARAQQALERAMDEGRNLLTYDRFMQAVMQKAPDAAVISFAEISEGSVYRELGAVQYLEMRKGFVKNHLLRAQNALKAGAQGCRAAQPHLDAILAVDPAAAVDTRVRALQSRCTAPAALAQRTGANEAAPGPAAAPAASAEEASAHAQPPPPQVQAGGMAMASRDPTFLAKSEGDDEAQDKTLEDAQHAYIQGDYRQAIQIAKKHTRTDPVRAWRVIGGAACYLGDADLVRKTLEHLPGQKDSPAQRFVHQVCARNGLTP